MGANRKTIKLEVTYNPKIASEDKVFSAISRIEGVCIVETPYNSYLKSTLKILNNLHDDLTRKTIVLNESINSLTEINGRVEEEISKLKKEREKEKEREEKECRKSAFRM